MKKKYIGLIVFCLIAVILLMIILQYNGCIGGTKGIKVTLDTVSYRSITQTVDASGKIYPENEVKIKADVSGEIVALPVEEGDSVIKGQLLMKVDPIIYQAQVSQSEAEMDRTRSSWQQAQQMAAQEKAQYEKAQSDYERNLKLYQDKVISSSEFEQIKSTYLAAKASYSASQATVAGNHYAIAGAKAGLTQAQDNLSSTIIRAPTSGIISQLLVKNGERVVGTQQMDGTHILTIADLGKMEVRVDVSETDILKVSIGDTSRIRVDAFRDHTFTGVVSKIAVSSVGLNSGTGANTDEVTNYTVHILILPASYSRLREQLGKGKFLFKPGMSAGVEIQTKRMAHTLSVPINAVTTRSIAHTTDSTGKDTKDSVQTAVFVYDKATGAVQTRAVKTGVQDNEYIQIVTGLKEGEQVVVAPYSAIARLLQDKSVVTPTDKNKLYQSEGSD